MTRVPEPTRDELDPDARAVYDQIATTRGATRGPYGVLLHHPPLCERVAALGEQLRFRSGLPGPDRELAILTVGREVEAAYEWYAHEIIARREGTRPEAIAVVRDGARRPAGLTAREALIIDTVRALYRARRLTRAEFARAEAELGRRGLVELVTLAGLLRDDRRDPQRLRRRPAAGRAAAVSAPGGLSGVAAFGLVHGAGHGAWCWERLIPALAALGHRAWAMDLPCDDPTAGRRALRGGRGPGVAAHRRPRPGRPLAGRAHDPARGRAPSGPAARVPLRADSRSSVGASLDQVGGGAGDVSIRSCADTPGASPIRTAPRGSGTRRPRATSSITTARPTDVRWAFCAPATPGGRAAPRALPALGLAARASGPTSCAARTAPSRRPGRAGPPGSASASSRSSSTAAIRRSSPGRRTSPRCSIASRAESPRGGTSVAPPRC